MLSIGEFAQATGLTVKALRHYDERGLLVPARTDPCSRHRAYGDAQILDAVLIRALRDADLPVESVRRALDGPVVARSELDTFHAEVTAARTAQDQALDAAHRLVAALRDPAPVEERDAPALHWAGLVARVAMDASDEDMTLAEEQANDACGAMYGRLVADGNPPCGAFWTSLGAASDDPETAELTLCWPLDRPADGDLAVDGWEIRTGTLPARRELVARWEHAEDDLTARGLPHPAFVALLAELVAREADGRDTGNGIAGVRQIVLGSDGGPAGIELAITLR